MAEFTFKHPSTNSHSSGSYITSEKYNFMEITAIEEKIPPPENIYLDIASTNNTTLDKSNFPIKYSKFKEEIESGKILTMPYVNRNIWLSVGIMNGKNFIELYGLTDLERNSIADFEFKISYNLLINPPITQ